MNNLYNKNNMNHRRNFMSADSNYAINSYGEVFSIGAHVKHDNKEAGNAEILSFEIDEKTKEVLAVTTKGSAHIDFIQNIYTDTTIPFIEDSECTIEPVSTMAIEMIKKERMEQINKHKFGMFHDLQWRSSELIQAALFCIDPMRFDWPKSFDKKYEDKIDERDLIGRLVVAAAFIAAEIDRLESVNFIKEEAEKEMSEDTISIDSVKL